MPLNPNYSIERFNGSHRHEVFYGRNRQKSIRYGLVVFLVPELHNMSKNGVHFNKAFDLYLKKLGQKAFEETYPNKNFIEEFGRNYL